MTSMLLSSLAVVVAAAGCLEPRPQPAGDAPADAGPRASPEIRSWAVRSENGRVYAPSEAPRRPVIVIEGSAPLSGEPEPIALFAGDPDEALLRDLEEPPLRESTEARRVGVVLHRRGTAIEVRAAAALTPARGYTVAVGGWASDPAGAALDGPFVATFRVAEGAAAGAALTGAWPADGSAGVPTRIQTIAVRFDADIDGDDAIRLIEDDGAEVSVRRQRVLCELIGWPAGRCVVLRPDATLAAETVHHIDVGDRVRDATGASIGPLRTTFRTGSGGMPPEPAFTEMACAIDETSVSIGCVLADDRSITLRFAADAPVRAWFSVESAIDAAVASRGEAELRLDDLSEGTGYEATLRTVDLAGRERVTPLALATEADLAAIAITEVRADARGPEPAQEYVEVANLGSEPVDLAGFTIADRPDREGDVVARSVLLPPFARALLVADAFDPVHPDDDPVPAGVPLVRMGSSLAGGGLTNGGEPLFLRDPSGRRVSSAPALAAPGAGVCIVRATEDARRGDEAAFAADAASGCTPGRPDRVP